MTFPRERLLFPVCCSSVVLAALTAYSNHFHNSFHFDDSHTIENNLYIHDLRNVPLFFRSSKTFSSLPSNQSYRPLVTTTLALDYRLGGGLDPVAFHADSFALFAAQCLLLFFLFRRILDASGERPGNRWLALFGAAWYALHAANAETVNYLISRSEILSTLGVVSALQLRAASSKARKYHLYLLPAMLGVLAKESAAMFAPLLFLYAGLIERQLSVAEILRPRNLGRLALATLPAFLACGAMVVLSLKMAPSFVSGGSSRLDYLLTQPFVVLHYFLTFLLPLNLAADTDWKLIHNPFDDRVIVGVAFIAAMVALAVRASRERAARPVALGILWFFVALLPTSSLVPLSEVMNDHRLYFPLVGLMLAACSAAGLALERAQRALAAPWRLLAPGAAILLLAGHAYGTRARNEVWRSEETLWLDVTRKSPENPRGLMNYGIALMGKGRFPEAQGYFARALAVAPQYGYAHVNLAIALGAQGRPAEAEQHFLEGLRYQPGLPAFHYFYARWLGERGRLDEAAAHLSRALELSPADVSSRRLLLEILARKRDWPALSALARETLEILPGDAQALASAREAREGGAAGSKPGKELQIGESTSAEEYLAQSLAYYQQARYQETIAACDRALKLRPTYAEAFNNKCSAFNMLGRYAEAKAACETALRLRPDFELARNNLAVAKEGRTR